MTSEIKFEDYLAVETAGGATWHPDGKRIAFTSNSTGLYQIYTCDIEKGKSLPRVQLTNEEDRCTDPRYLSDGTLVFTRDRNGDENFQIGIIDNDRSVEWLTSNLEVKHRITFASDSYVYFSANITDKARLDVYRWKIPLNQNWPELIFEPDKGLIAVSGAMVSDTKILMTQFYGNLDQQLLILDLLSGELANLTAAICRGTPTRWEVVRLIDSEHILVITDHNSDSTRLAILSTHGRYHPLDRLADLTKFDIENHTFTKDSTWTYFLENQEGYSTLHRAKFSDQNFSDFETLAFPLRGVVPTGDARTWSHSKGLVLSNDEHLLAVTMSSGNQPTSIWILDIKDMTNWRAVDVSLAGLDPSTFVEPTLHRFNSFDQLSVPYFKYMPLGGIPENGWPAILMIHGGPEAQIRPDFNPVIQFYLSAGFAVITPNIRGSDGYGRKYLDLDNVEKRLDSIRDIKHLALYLKESDNEIDGDRLVVYGGSYGGFAVLSAMTEHPELWKAGVDIVGVSNFVTFLKNTAAWRRSLREAEYGSLEHDMDALVKISPIHKIDRISAPLFIIQGDNDERVPLSESVQIYEKLKAKELPVRLMRFADEGHGLAKLKNRIKAYSEVVEWLKRIV
ncbi:MAG: S9 family peptidase [Candidatus Thorarchaeota archaeon]|nr:S9 family peptidase [Candidatus Thorarchaeota archaeon]